MILQETTSSPSVYFYLAIIIPVLMIISIIFFIKKLRYNSKKVLKSVWISAIITLVLEGLFLIIIKFLPQPICSIGKECITNTGIALKSLFYTLSIIFLIVIFIYYLIKIIKR